MKNLSDVFTKEVVQELKENKSLITPELLDEIRSFGNEGKRLALEILETERDREGYFLDAFGNRMSFLGDRGLKSAYSKMNLSEIHYSEIKRCQDIEYFKNNYIQIRTKTGLNFPDMRSYQNEFIEKLVHSPKDDVIGLMGRQCAAAGTLLHVLVNDGERVVRFDDLFNSAGSFHESSDPQKSTEHSETDKISRKPAPLSDVTPRKFIETIRTWGLKILTPTGFKRIIEVHKTVPYRKFKVRLENGLEMDCAFNHVFIQGDGTEIYAKDSLGCILQTVRGNSEVVSVIDTGVEENMYDISIDSEEETYFSDGILSHNSGKSISTGIYLTHLFTFDHDKNIGIVANKGAMAREFLNNVKNMVLALPHWMQVGISVWNKGAVENESNMRILTDSPGSNSFRGYSIHCLVVDECVAYNETITIRDDETGEVFTTAIGDFYNLI